MTKKPGEDSSNASRGKKGSAISVGGDATGNVFTVGSKNKVDAKLQVHLNKVVLPPPGSVDLGRELEQIRSLLQAKGGDNQQKIVRALDDATEEARKPQPDRAEVGSALKRALDYAKKGEDFAEVMGKLAPHVTSAVAWLGSNWQHLLGIVGLAL